MSFITLDFPREVLEIGSDGQKGYRRLVKDWESLERYWRGKNGSGNVYFTAYGYRALTPPRNHRVDYNTPIIRHFVCDFDCKNFRERGKDIPFEEMHDQVKRLHQHLLAEDTMHYIWFSGGGFHVWVPLDTVYTPSNGFEVTRVKDGGRMVLSKWHKELNLYSNDPTVAFDTAGMIRIPNSYNSKRGCWSIPVDTESLMTMTHDDLIDKAQDSIGGFIQHGNKPLRITIPERKQIFTPNRKDIVDLPDISIDGLTILPCLAQSAMGEGNPPHRARLHFASYMASRLRWFFPPNSVKDSEKEKHVEFITRVISEQGWVDFDESFTRGQVQSIVFGGSGNNGYNAGMCRTIIADGFCSGRCKFYDGTAEGMM